MSRLILLAGPLGRSGVQSVANSLTMFTDVHVPAWGTPTFAGRLADELVHLDASGPSWLPRRAGEAVQRISSIFALAGRRESWERASAPLVEPSVYIPVYGYLPLPLEAPGRAWGAAVRRTIVDGTDGPTVVRVGPHLRGVHRWLLQDEDILAIITRHPYELFAGLTESNVDGMRPDEAASAIEAHYRHLFDLARHVSAATVLRYEEVKDAPLEHPAGWTSGPLPPWGATVNTTRATLPSEEPPILERLDGVARLAGYC